MSTNTLCTNKIRVIYFCPNCVNFLPENVHFFNFIYLFIYLLFLGEGGEHIKDVKDHIKNFSINGINVSKQYQSK